MIIRFSQMPVLILVATSPINLNCNHFNINGSGLTETFLLCLICVDDVDACVSFNILKSSYLRCLNQCNRIISGSISGQ